MNMILGDRLRDLRESKKLSQGDIEKRSGLLRCYVSRVEKGHTVPSVETLEKLARALEVPMYRIFYDGDAPTAPLIGLNGHRHHSNGNVWGSSGKDARFLAKLCGLLRRMEESDRKLLLFVTQKMTARATRAAP